MSGLGGRHRSWTLMASGVPTRLAGALGIAGALWLAVAWALDWLG